MRIGIVITTFERPEYLWITFLDLFKSELPSGCELCIVDDSSKDSLTRKFLREFPMWWRDDVPYSIEFNEVNRGIAYGLRFGWEYFFQRGFDVLLNLDSDVILRPDWLLRELELLGRYPDNVVTGFHTAAHGCYSEHDDYRKKKSLGGVNCCFRRHLFNRIRSHLMGNDWDHQLVRDFEGSGIPFICTTPSVVEHIGDNSSLGHMEVDRAVDYGTW